MTFTIHETPRRPADLDTLVAEVNASPFIGAWTRDEISMHLATRSLRLYYDGDEVAGVSAWVIFDGGRWAELGPFFARDRFRGRGLGRQLMQTAVDINHEAGRSLYGVTKNDIVKRLFVQLGMAELPLAKLPPPVLLYLTRKMTPMRLLRGLRKLDRTQTIAHFIALPPKERLS